MLYKLMIISLLALTCANSIAQDRQAYIIQYQDIAVAEMLRSGVPASIKLAQAILESNAGHSTLAIKAHNHFGIKCGGSWNGKTYHRADDDYHNGKLVKSCFREFNSVLECYEAHSDFLTDSGKTGRYGPLFSLDITDYKGWAKGLSKAGYATDPQYATRLITLIDKYELYRFDNEYENQLAIRQRQVSPGMLHILYQNELQYALAFEGDNTRGFADRYEVKANRIRKYNDDIFTNDQLLKTNSKVYLEAKRSKYKGKRKYHVLREGEDMTYVAQEYGIKLDALLKRNHLQLNEVPQPNQKIYLKGNAKHKIRTQDPYEVPTEDMPAPYNAVRENSEVVSVAYTNNLLASTESYTEEDTTNGQRHIVVRGDTLFGIARRYGLSLDELKKKNKLSADTIHVGQKLICQ